MPEITKFQVAFTAQEAQEQIGMLRDQYENGLLTVREFVDAISKMWIDTPVNGEIDPQTGLQYRLGLGIARYPVK